MSDVVDRQRLRDAVEAQRRGTPAEAERLWRAVLQQAPERPDGYLGLAVALGAQGRTAEAAAIIVPATALFPDNAALQIEHARTVAARHGLWALTAAKFLPGTVVPSLAGALGMDVRRFLLFDGLAALIYGGGYITAGFLFHHQVQKALVWSDRVGHGIMGLGLVLVTGYLACKYVLRRRHKTPETKTGLADQGSDACARILCLDASQPRSEAINQ